jgi:hypothetical protein
MKVLFGKLRGRHLVMLFIFSLAAYSAGWLIMVSSQPYEVGAYFLAKNRDVIKVTGAVRDVSLDFISDFHVDGQSAEYQVSVTGETGHAVAQLKLVNDNSIWKVNEAKFIP